MNAKDQNPHVPGSRNFLINAAAFVVVVAGMSAAKSLVIPFLLAAFLAVIFSPSMFLFRKLGVRPVVSVLFIVVLIIVIEIAVATLIGTSLAEFTRSLPSYQKRLHEMTVGLLDWLENKGIHITHDVIMEHINPGRIMAMVANMLTGLTGLVTNSFIIIITFVFIMLETAGFLTKMKAIMGVRNTADDQFGEISQGVNRYLAIKTLTSLATGISVGLLLGVIGVSYPILWGLVAFLLNYVPTIGSIIAAVPAVMLALVQLGWGAALATVTGYLVINISISNIIEPRVMGTRVGLSPLVIFASMAFWGWVLGPVGMLLSVPLTMTFKIALAGNENTQWVAIVLGTDRDAEAALAGGENLPDENGPAA
ncbi:MAG TPA: AI-2E family transporter [Thermodesulfobacteriaceae bacterium]|nr:AI-2E family transporter [Thermodesulfobacteriaceae bacterium]